MGVMLMIKFEETLTGEMLYKRVLKKTFNTPLAGVVAMMYIFSWLSFLYDLSRLGTVALEKDKWVILILFLLPFMMWHAFKNVKNKIYKRLSKNDTKVIEYSFSTWYIEIKDWEDREIKWTEIYRFEETKKTFEIYLNPTQSITIDKHILSHEEIIGIKELAEMKLKGRKIRNFHKYKN